VRDIYGDGIDDAAARSHSLKAIPPEEKSRRHRGPTPLTKTLLKSRKLRENILRRKIQVTK
jgi:hypothetical protein